MKTFVFAALLACSAPAVFAQTAAAPAAPAAAPATVTAVCKDGTTFSGTTLSGACSGHKGIDKKAGKAAAVLVPNTTAKVAPTPAAPAASGDAAAMAAGGKVWANASTKVYHCSGDKYYGKTKKGEYMSEADAKAKGFHASRGKACA